MVAGVAERFFTGLDPKIPQKVGVRLYGVSLVVVVGSVYELEP